METKNGCSGIKHVVRIATNFSHECEHCDKRFQGDIISGAVNHYIEKHGYRLLHVGTEDELGENGGPRHNTIAIVGCANVPKPKKTQRSFGFSYDGGLPPIKMAPDNEEKKD